MALEDAKGGVAQLARDVLQQYQLFRRFQRFDRDAVTARSWWNTRHTGLWQAVAAYESENGALPRIDFGTLFEWAYLAAKSNRIRRPMRNQWKNQTAVCVGNGPSIATTELGLLNNQYVIGTNRAYLLLKSFRPKAFHLVVQDNHRLKELGPELASASFPLHIGNCYFTPEWAIAPWIAQKKRPPLVYLPKLKWHSGTDDPNVQEDPKDKALRFEATFEPGFSSEPSQGLFYGFSVIFSAIQLAAYFGAKKIVCIGIDMSYDNGINFVNGVTNVFPTFNYKMHGEPMFQLLANELEKRGVELVNATVGGAVDCIQRQSLSDALGLSRSLPRNFSRAA